MKVGRWRILDKFLIPNLDQPDETYLTRWRILETPWAGLFLHRMDGPDSRPVYHDHPWSFVSLVVRGGYREMRLDLNTRATNARHIRRVNVIRRDDAHFIFELDRTPTWTLVIIGKRRRTWGYLRPVANSGRGSWYWTPFDRDQLAEQFDAAMAKRGTS